MAVRAAGCPGGDGVGLLLGEELPSGRRQSSGSEGVFEHFSSQHSGQLEDGFTCRVKGVWVGRNSVHDIEEPGRHEWPPGGRRSKRGHKAGGIGANVL